MTAEPGTGHALAEALYRKHVPIEATTDEGLAEFKAAFETLIAAVRQNEGHAIADVVEKMQVGTYPVAIARRIRRRADGVPYAIS